MQKILKTKKTTVQERHSDVMRSFTILFSLFTLILAALSPQQQEAITAHNLGRRYLGDISVLKGVDGKLLSPLTKRDPSTPTCNDLTTCTSKTNNCSNHGVCVDDGKGCFSCKCSKINADDSGKPLTGFKGFGASNMQDQ